MMSGDKVGKYAVCYGDDDHNNPTPGVTKTPLGVKEKRSTTE
jgi:hypothetical protein